jgi:hypothetical protein
MTEALAALEVAEFSPIREWVPMTAISDARTTRFQNPEAQRHRELTTRGTDGESQ